MDVQKVDTSVEQAVAGSQEQDVCRLALRASIKERAALHKALKPLFTAVFTEGLRALEEALPNHHVEDHPDQAAFQTLRNRVLNVGNQKYREIPNILRDFIMKQIAERTTERREFPAQGPYGLPAGIHHPSEKRAI